MSSDSKHPSAVASALYPGLGQVYNGNILKGVVLMSLAAVSAFLVLITILMILAVATSPEGSGFSPELLVFLVVAVVLYLPVWMYAIYNAYKVG